MTRPRYPFAPIKTKLEFPQLLKLGGGNLRCGWCSYLYPLDATTSEHECNPRLIPLPNEVEVKPLWPPSLGVFYGEADWPDILKKKP